MHFRAAMVRLGSALVATLALAASACGSSASLEYANGAPTLADAGDESPYPDAAPPTNESGADAGATDAPPAPKCPAGKDGKGNVCVRVLRGGEGPSINEDSKALGLDGRGAVLVGLSAVEPTGGELSFVAKTWFPSESSGTGKLAASELPKIAEPLTVAPGKYYALAIFRDQEPYMRPGLAVGDYVPRLGDIPTVVVGADGGVSIDVVLHPVRAVDVDVALGASPPGSGTGPVRAWLVSGTSIVGEGALPCADLNEERVARVRVLTTDTGTLSLAAALFDVSLPADGTPLELPLLPPGSMHEDPAARPEVSLASGEWLAPTVPKISLEKVVPLGAPKPSDPTPSCATASMAPLK